MAIAQTAPYLSPTDLSTGHDCNPPTIIDHRDHRHSSQAQAETFHQKHPLVACKKRLNSTTATTTLRVYLRSLEPQAPGYATLCSKARCDPNMATNSYVCFSVYTRRCRPLVTTCLTYDSTTNDNEPFLDDLQVRYPPLNHLLG